MIHEYLNKRVVKLDYSLYHELIFCMFSFLVVQLPVLCKATIGHNDVSMVPK